MEATVAQINLKIAPKGGSAAVSRVVAGNSPRSVAVKGRIVWTGRQHGRDHVGCRREARASTDRRWENMGSATNDGTQEGARGGRLGSRELQGSREIRLASFLPGWLRGDVATPAAGTSPEQDGFGAEPIRNRRVRHGWFGMDMLRSAEFRTGGRKQKIRRIRAPRRSVRTRGRKISERNRGAGPTMGQRGCDSGRRPATAPTGAGALF
jgi:hypothetical protein